MSRFTRRVFFLAPVLALFAVGTSAPDAARKCGGPPPSGKPFLSVDGVITGNFDKPEESMVSMFKPEDIHRIEIVCMNPTDSTFNRTQGWGVVSIWTKQGPALRVEEALDVIRETQDAHFAKHGRYISALGHIQFPESMKPVRMTMEADEKGWIARTTAHRLLRTCAMFDGTVAAPLPIGPRKTACNSEP